MLITVFIAIYIIIILNFICTYNYTKAQTLVYIIIMNTNDVCLFFLQSE